MYPSPAPTIDVMVQTEPAPGWQVLAAVGPCIIIFLAEIVWIVFLVRANRRSKTAGRLDWEQLRWALDASLSEDAQRAKMGRAVLAAISKLQLSKDDGEFLRVASRKGVTGMEESGKRQRTIKNLETLECTGTRWVPEHPRLGQGPSNA